jgi:tRNA G18 (ribose-2'-O)-methylase SpoU
VGLVPINAYRLGVQHLWLIDPQPKAASSAQAFAADADELKEHAAFARKATDWTTIREFSSTAECIKALRAEGRTLWATDLSQHAECLLPPGGSGGEAGLRVPEKLAIAFGTESVGCTEELLQAADLRVYLPLRGFADSLNLSVAAALVLHQ